MRPLRHPLVVFAVVFVVAPVAGIAAAVAVVERHWRKP